MILAKISFRLLPQSLQESLKLPSLFIHPHLLELSLDLMLCLLPYPPSCCPSAVVFCQTVVSLLKFIACDSKMRTWTDLGKHLGEGWLRADCQGTENPILIAINFVPAARLAPDKGTRYSLDKSRIFERSAWDIPSEAVFSECLHVHITRPAFLSLPNFQILFIHSAGHCLTSSLPPHDDVWRGGTPGASCS